MLIIIIPDFKFLDKVELRSVIFNKVKDRDSFFYDFSNIFNLSSFTDTTTNFTHGNLLLLKVWIIRWFYCCNYCIKFKNLHSLPLRNVTLQLDK